MCDRTCIFKRVHFPINYFAIRQGVEVDVKLRDGAVFRGVLHAATPFDEKEYEIVLKATYKLVRNL